MQYYAIIGDIKRSKKIENRCEIQEKLKKILDNVNSIYNNDISAKFLITLGDEFQGLLEITAPILEIIKYIQIYSKLYNIFKFTKYIVTIYQN